MPAEAIAPYTLDEVTIYVLRHSSIVRQILHLRDRLRSGDIWV